MLSYIYVLYTAICVSDGLRLLFNACSGLLLLALARSCLLVLVLACNSFVCALLFALLVLARAAVDDTKCVLSGSRAIGFVGYFSGSDIWLIDWGIRIVFASSDSCFQRFSLIWDTLNDFGFYLHGLGRQFGGFASLWVLHASLSGAICVPLEASEVKVICLAFPCERRCWFIENRWIQGARVLAVCWSLLERAVDLACCCMFAQVIAFMFG